MKRQTLIQFKDKFSDAVTLKLQKSVTDKGNTVFSLYDGRCVVVLTADEMKSVVEAVTTSSL